MARDLSRALTEVTFQCKACLPWGAFKRDPARVVDDPNQDHHPFAYFAPCPRCGAECAQAEWERSLIKGWASATGPRTPEGKAASAKNLEGHPTPEEALRTRFNAMKHGLTAKVAKYFPAKPDGYSFCSGCEVDRAWCGQQPACVKQSQNFMLHHAAFEQRNPRVLQGMYSEMHAAIFAVLQQILQTIIADGSKIVSPEWYTDKDGAMCLAKYIDPNTGQVKTLMNIEAHPLFKPLAELLSRTGLTLTDMGMTARVLDDDETEMGSLAGGRDDKTALAEFAARQSESVKALERAFAQSRERRGSDPVLIEHQAIEGGAS